MAIISITQQRLDVLDTLAEREEDFKSYIEWFLEGFLSLRRRSFPMPWRRAPKERRCSK